MSIVSYRICILAFVWSAAGVPIKLIHLIRMLIRIARSATIHSLLSELNFAFDWMNLNGLNGGSRFFFACTREIQNAQIGCRIELASGTCPLLWNPRLNSEKNNSDMRLLFSHSCTVIWNFVATIECKNGKLISSTSQRQNETQSKIVIWSISMPKTFVHSNRHSFLP